MNHARSRWLPLLTLGALLLPSGGHSQQPAKKERDIITRDELLEVDTKAPDLYQAVRRLRPHFLVFNRGPRRVCEALDPNCAPARGVATVVYLDGMRAGDLEALKGIPIRKVDEVRYLTPNKAGVEFGAEHEGGAILVKIHHP